MDTVLLPVRALLVFVGESTLILLDAARRLFRRPWEIRETINQMAFVGVASVPIVTLTGFFSGAVISLYLSKFLVSYGATQFLGATVGLTVLREIGPVIAGIMVSARCGSAMAAQIGTMTVTEQVDALRMLSVNPTNYLVIPRILAGMLMLPVLTLVAIWAGITGGLLVAMGNGIPYETFIQSFQQFGSPDDLWKGLAKAPIFGIIVAVVACQQGLRTTEGAVGVGRATTNSVVISMVLVYVANFVIASLLFR
jgi:phospholipid/cholesterol/gamma-HCH transport system permease protein